MGIHGWSIRNDTFIVISVEWMKALLAMIASVGQNYSDYRPLLDSDYE